MNATGHFYVSGSWDVRSRCVEVVYIQMISALDLFLDADDININDREKSDPLKIAYARVLEIKDIMDDTDANVYSWDDRGLDGGNMLTVLNYTTVLLREWADYFACSQTISKHSKNRFVKTVDWIKTDEVGDPTA